MDNFREVFHLGILNISVFQWASATALFFLFWSGLGIFKRVSINRLSRISKHLNLEWNHFLVDLLKNTKPWFLAAVAILISIYVINAPQRITELVVKGFMVVLLFQASVWGKHAIQFALRKIVSQKSAAGQSDPSFETTLTALGFLANIVLYALILLLILDNLGFNVSALIAGLGIGGIAVALSVQAILGDLFSSMSIIFDKPFVIGDAIVVGDAKGIVEKIGLKTTRLRSVDGEQLIFSNTEILKSKIQNFKRMNERRIMFTVGIVYETSVEKIAGVTTILKEILQAHKEIRLDHVFFKEMGSFSLNFEVVYFVQSSDYLTYAGIQEKINLEILRRFSKEQISLAYPTQTLYLQKMENEVSRL